MAGPMVDSENRYTENLLRYTKSNSKQITENMQGITKRVVLKIIEESMQGICKGLLRLSKRLC
jgi:hypothetical protein